MTERKTERNRFKESQVKAELDVWRERAACKGMAQAMGSFILFFPERGGDFESGKDVCKQCPARLECLDFAMREKIKFGIWGGLSEQSRRSLARAWRTSHRLFVASLEPALSEVAASLAENYDNYFRIDDKEILSIGA